MHYILAILTAGILGLSALPAAAQPCLEGSARLADQRALRELEAAIEASCPCASFTGGPGQSHASYVGCAKQVRNNAEFFADLREECHREATVALKKTTCGGTKIACGRYKETAREPVSCRVKPASRCADGPTFSESACSQTHCSEVEEWTAGTCLDPRAPGPFNAGARVITYTKPSAVNPAMDRVLNTVIWYPTSDTGPISGAHGAILDASVDGSGGPYPVVLFSHGSCAFPTQSIFLTALLATHGFVVVAPPHPGNTLSEFPSCGTFQAQVNSAAERPQDMIFVLDQILAADLDSGSDFFGVIDETEVAMSGHSFGGLTTYLTQAIEPRIVAAMPMAAATGGGSMLTVPSLTMLGQIDSTVNNAGIRNAYANSSAPKILVEIADAGHYAFSNSCFPNSPDCNPPVTLTQDEAHDAVLRYAIPFLQVQLKDDLAWSPLLTAPPSPTFVVESEP
jgi:dienelactone hydrolase